MEKILFVRSVRGFPVKMNSLSGNEHWFISVMFR